MADQNITTVPVGVLPTATNKFLTRAAADTNDTSITADQLLTFQRANLYGLAGQGPAIKTGTNARAGTATLTAGTVTIANTSVTANTLVKAWIQNGTQTNASFLRITTTAGVGFTVTSGNATDTSGIGWEMTEIIP